MADTEHVLLPRLFGELPVHHGSRNSGRGSSAYGSGAGIRFVHVQHEAQTAYNIDIFSMDLVTVDGHGVSRWLADDCEKRNIGALFRGLPNGVHHANLHGARGPDGLHFVGQRLVRLYFYTALRACQAKTLCLNKNDNVPCIHNRNFKRTVQLRFNRIDRVARRQKFTGGGAHRIAEVQHDLCAGSGDAVNPAASGSKGFSVLDRDIGD